MPVSFATATLRFCKEVVVIVDDEYIDIIKVLNDIGLLACVSVDIHHLFIHTFKLRF